jgi:hypothetical protein
MDKEKNTGNSNDDKLSRLLEKQKQVDAQLAAEKLRLAKRKQKDDRKLFALVGREACEAAEKSPEFRLMIAQTLGGAVTDPAARRFLEGRGYIA